MWKFWGAFLFCILLIPCLAVAEQEPAGLINELGNIQSGQQEWGSAPPPSYGTMGRFPNRDSLNRPAITSLLDRLQPDISLNTRGAKEVSLYQSASPSVVLIATEDGFGSGSLIARNGTILTNWHVIKDHTEVGVVFKPKTEGGKITARDVRRARVLRVDEIADLALVQVTAVPADVLPLTIGKMSDISVGSDVHAIGHPTGETWTYTKGLVSQIRNGYEWPDEEKLEHKADVIQTQTPINPGNSGGPLLSDSGKLVGVNSFRKTGEALNFAIAVSEVERFLNRQVSRTFERSPATAPAPAGKEDCTPVFSKPYRSKKNDANVVAVDILCEGKATGWIVTPDDRAKPIMFLIDSGSYGKPDTMILDLDRDGKWDVSYYDSHHTGKWDLKGYHPDGTLIASRYEPYNE